MVTATMPSRRPAPEVSPSLAGAVRTPPPEDPDTVEIFEGQPAKGPSADQIFDKYIQAMGGAQQLAKLTSFVAKRTYAGYDTDLGKAAGRSFCQSPGAAHHDAPCAQWRPNHDLR